MTGTPGGPHVPATPPTGPVTARTVTYDQTLLADTENSDRPCPPATWDAYYAAVHREVLHAGWYAVIREARHDDPPGTDSWVYTLGLNASTAGPDLIITGLPSALALEVLTPVAALIRAGEIRFPRDTTLITTLPDGMTVQFRPVHDSWQITHTGLAAGYRRRRHGERQGQPGTPPYVQVLLPGPDGHFGTPDHAQHYPALPMHQQRR